TMSGNCPGDGEAVSQQCPNYVRVVAEKCSRASPSVSEQLPGGVPPQQPRYVQRNIQPTGRTTVRDQPCPRTVCSFVLSASAVHPRTAHGPGRAKLLVHMRSWHWPRTRIVHRQGAAGNGSRPCPGSVWARQLPEGLPRSDDESQQ